MKPAPLVIGLSTAVLLASLGVLEHQAAALRGRRASLAAAQGRADASRHELARLGRARQAPPPLSPVLSRPTVAASDLPATANSGLPVPGTHEALLRKRAADRAALDAHLRPLFEKLGLNPAQIDQVEQSILDHNERKDDITAGALAQNLPLTDPTIAQLRQDEMAKFKGEVVPLIGESGLEQYFQVEHQEPAADLVAGLAGNPLGGGATITPAQAEQLTQLISAASPTYQKGGTVHYDDVDWTGVQAKAQQLLSPPQFEAFQSTVARAIGQTQAVQAAQAALNRRAQMVMR
jgi:hypothetical protein